ncbi:MAG: hypothetical protein Q8N15_06325, partial [Bacillota bacterium]|nr:hypothetical protein [Bacillota bacterium]
ADTVIFDKLIVSTHDGYLHPTRDQEPIVIDSFDKMDATARSIGIRRRRQLKRLKLDGQFKMALGKYDKPVYEAFTDAEIEEYQPKKKRPTVIRKANPADPELPKDPLPNTIIDEKGRVTLVL